MRKALIPLLASLAVCGGATTAMVMSSARAEPGPHKPVMIAAAATTPDMQLAANDAPPPRDARMHDEGDRAARRKQICTDLYARQTAKLAYLQASLQLTAAERPLFKRWSDAKLSIAHRHADRCAQRPERQGRSAAGERTAQAGEARGPATRLAREEDFLKQRLADIETERPALEAFTNALSPAQKMQLARAGMQDRMGGRGDMMRHRMFADARGPGRGMGPNRMDSERMGPDRMEHGPMGPGAMGRPPGPPDDAQAPTPER